MQRDAASLLDILTAARLARDFVTDSSKELFLDDVKSQAAVTREIEVIGEATKRISAEFKASHQEIPWRKMAGMRDVLIHAYDKVDVDELWQAVESSIPELILLIEPLVPREGAT